MARRLIVNIAQKIARVVPVATAPGAGETLIGTIDHDEAGNEDGVGAKMSHVLYHHVELLMIKAKLFDYPSYKIVTT
jgi:hypothetical protein